MSGKTPESILSLCLTHVAAWFMNLTATERTCEAFRVRLVLFTPSGESPTNRLVSVFDFCKYCLVTCFLGFPADSLPILIVPQFVTMFYDVCGKNYDVYGGRTWFVRLTLIGNDL